MRAYLWAGRIATATVHDMERLLPLSADGVFSTAMATRVGHDSYSLRQLAAQNRIRRLFRGWWALHDPQLPVAPWDNADPRIATRSLHRLKCLAYLQHFDGRAVPSHHSALVMHAVVTYACDLATVHLARTADRSSRAAAGAVVHTRSARPTSHSPDGHPTADLALAVVQTGIAARPESALVAADDALRQELITNLDIAVALQDCTRHPGVAQIRHLLQFADGRHESPGETLTALVLRGLQLDFVPQQVISTDGGTYRVDFRLTRHRVIIEFDGAIKYRGRDDTLWNEKRREDHLRAAGYEVVRLVWSDLRTPGRVRAAVNAAIARR